MVSSSKVSGYSYGRVEVPEGRSKVEVESDICLWVGGQSMESSWAGTGEANRPRLWMLEDSFRSEEAWGFLGE